MPKAEHLKDKRVKFGSGQPTNLGGRKKDRLNEIWKIVIGSDNEEDRVIIMSKEEKYKLIESLFELPLSKLQGIVENDSTPAFVVNIAMSIVGDIEERRTLTIDKYFDRFFGKAESKIDMTVNEIGNDKFKAFAESVKNIKVQNE